MSEVVVSLGLVLGVAMISALWWWFTYGRRCEGINSRPVRYPWCRDPTDTAGCPMGGPRCPTTLCDCFIDLYPDDPMGLHPEAFAVWTGDGWFVPLAEPKARN